MADQDSLKITGPSLLLGEGLLIIALTVITGYLAWHEKQFFLPKESVYIIGIIIVTIIFWKLSRLKFQSAKAIYLGLRLGQIILFMLWGMLLLSLLFIEMMLYRSLVYLVIVVLALVMLTNLWPFNHSVRQLLAVFTSSQSLTNYRINQDISNALKKPYDLSRAVLLSNNLKEQEPVDSPVMPPHYQVQHLLALEDNDFESSLLYFKLIEKHLEGLQKKEKLILFGWQAFYQALLGETSSLDLSQDTLSALNGRLAQELLIEKNFGRAKDSFKSFQNKLDQTRDQLDLAHYRPLIKFYQDFFDHLI